VLNTYGQRNTWVYDSSSVTQSKLKRRFIGTIMVTGQILPNLYYDKAASGLHPVITNMIEYYEVGSHINFTMGLHLYSDIRGNNESIGYLVKFDAGLHSHTLLAPDESLYDAIETLSRYNGKDYTMSNMLVQVATNMSKRDTTYQWQSFTGWGGNEGYIYDLEQWDEYQNFESEYNNNDIMGVVGQTQPCDTSMECYFVYNKYCVAIGFSNQQGQDDAEVGEVYYMAYGGLDNQCEEG
ncbi:hypothetical protein V1509DRAFT_573048, partial [Lipomyces kononenkoae]